MKRIRQTEIIKEKCCYPYRVVLQYWEELDKYVTHIEVIPDDNEPYLVSGNYFKYQTMAHNNFDKRCLIESENGQSVRYSDDPKFNIFKVKGNK